MFLLFLLALQTRIDSDAGCIKCHESQAEDWKGSIHAGKDVGCVKCHGADSVTNKSRPHLFVEGFRRGKGKTSPALCAACHAKEFASWDASAHGEDTRDPSGRGKGCSSCHAFHETGLAEPGLILKESCSTCHKPGTEAIRFGERYLELAAGIPGGRPRPLRIEQHGLSETRLKALAAYNRSGRPPWLWVIPAVPAAAALVLWLRSAPRRRPA